MTQALPDPNVTAPILDFTQAIDITADLCPMTFVRTRLALDRLKAGDVLKVRLKGQEPRVNVPRTAESLGHVVLAVQEAADGVTTIWIRRR